MVVISRKVDYAIVTLFYLMEHSAGASAREIAEHFGLSRGFIANILKLLCQDGFIESQRGVHGGYRLSRTAAEISLHEIITSLDGPFRLMACGTPGDGDVCGLTDKCPVRNPLREVHDRLLAVLGEVTLADLRSQPRSLVTLTTESFDGFTSDLP